MRDVDWAYLAGIIDGEGSLMIGRQLSKHSAKAYYNGRLVIATTDKRLVDWCESLGIGFVCNSCHRSGKHQVMAYQINAGHAVLVKLIPEVYEYLVIKKEQADLILELDKAKAGGKSVEVLEKLKWKMSEFNGRGSEAFHKEQIAKLKTIEEEAKRKQQELLKDKEGRVCSECGTDIPVEKRRDVKFCSHACNLKSWKRRQKIKEGS